jgi:hypothetical protein
MSGVEQALIALVLVALIGGIEVARLRIMRRHDAVERRAGAPVGGLLDSTALGWVLDDERTLAQRAGHSLVLLLVVPRSRRGWDPRVVEQLVRRNELAVAVADGSVAIVAWAQEGDEATAARHRLAVGLVAAGVDADVGVTSISDGDVSAPAVLRAARRARVRASSIGATTIG